MKFHFLLILLVIVALLDPDPADQNQADPDPDLQHCKEQIISFKSEVSYTKVVPYLLR
jgi:hypothetical protein